MPQLPPPSLTRRRPKAGCDAGAATAGAQPASLCPCCSPAAVSEQRRRVASSGSRCCDARSHDPVRRRRPVTGGITTRCRAHGACGAPYRLGCCRTATAGRSGRSVSGAVSAGTSMAAGQSCDATIWCRGSAVIAVRCYAMLAQADTVGRGGLRRTADSCASPSVCGGWPDSLLDNFGTNEC